MEVDNDWPWNICEQTRPISLSKDLSMHTIALYWQWKIHLQMHQYRFILHSGQIANLVKLKAWITQHINNVAPEKLRSVVEHAICRFQLVTENDGQHTGHVLRKSHDN
ncbi:hypothetical protein CEXT_24271 [Caerostris extrusa]|uniref:Uncharacterized protein n=1 Tax=Caerostris extrusa TaxID=172846 RepID=A0AAV4PMU4_CAEEX|nr:hypothetical protein CEXT_24271 [Caerostris extrusa]